MLSLRINPDEKAGVYRAEMHITGKAPTEIATLRASMATDKPSFDAWAKALQLCMSRFLVNKGVQIRGTKEDDFREGTPSTVTAEHAGWLQAEIDRLRAMLLEVGEATKTADVARIRGIAERATNTVFG